VPDRYLIDANIHDKIVDAPGMLDLARRLVEDGAVVLLSTYVQADEIAATPDRDRARSLATVPVETVPVYGIVLGYWRLGMAPVSEREPFESLRGGNLDHTEDALIAATAQYEGATLVTEDVTLAKRAKREGIPVIGWDDFHAASLFARRRVTRRTPSRADAKQPRPVAARRTATRLPP
jgi:hypothetical protein